MSRRRAAQGPPGTGKTHTIVAIASALLQDKVPGASSVRMLPQKAATSGTGRGLTDWPLPQSRLLVCAQSNAAVDELVSRLAEKVPSSVRSSFFDDQSVTSQ